MGVSKAAHDLHERIETIDIHVHPSLKTYLFNHKLGGRHLSGKFWLPFFMRVDLPKTLKGGMDILVSSIYLPEREILTDCKAIRFFKRFARKRARRLFYGEPADETMKILNHFEKEVDAARVKKRRVAKVARSKTELAQIRGEGSIAIVHSIEGAHSFGGQIGNVEKFFDRGVCLTTLAHFYENEAVAPVRGIPESMSLFGCFKKPEGPNTGLTDFGRDVVDEMNRLGMIIDLTHCTAKARSDVFARTPADRPVVFSHVGVQPVADTSMSPTKEEMHKIADSDGVIGIILMNCWLGDPHKKNGLELFTRNVQAVVGEIGENHVAIGSDFDGFTDPPDDVKDIAKMPKLTQALLDAKFTEIQIEKFWGLNFKRTLELGWGRE